MLNLVLASWTAGVSSEHALWTTRVDELFVFRTALSSLRREERCLQSLYNVPEEKPPLQVNKVTQVPAD